jgi:hypothetical protein
MHYKCATMSLRSLKPLNFLLLFALWFSGHLAQASAPLSADQMAALQEASIQKLQSGEALNQKSGVDFSTLSASENLAFDYCNNSSTPDAVTKSGQKIKMLGAALVYASASNGSSILGHVGERFAFCLDYQYYNVLYDYSPFEESDWNDNFDILYNVKRATFSAAEKKSILNSNFVQAHFDVGAVYGEEQLTADRTIFEAWFKINGQTMYQMMMANVSRYAEQLVKIQTQQPLPAYKIPSDDCVTPVVQDFELINPNYISKHSPARLTPSFLYNFVKNHNVDRIIVYPSQRQFRILRKRAEGQSTALSWLLPASKDLSDGFGDSWALVYTQTHGLLKYVVVGPATGAVNMLAAGAETVYGIITEPVVLAEKLLKIKKKSSSPGAHRILRGLDDLFDSMAEVFSFQIRFPLPTDWTMEEQQFFQNFAQQSLLLDYLGAKYENAPVLVKSSIN